MKTAVITFEELVAQGFPEEDRPQAGFICDKPFSHGDNVALISECAMAMASVQGQVRTELNRRGVRAFAATIEVALKKLEALLCAGAPS